MVSVSNRERCSPSRPLFESLRVAAAVHASDNRKALASSGQQNEPGAALSGTQSTLRIYLLNAARYGMTATRRKISSTKSLSSSQSS